MNESFIHAVEQRRQPIKLMWRRALGRAPVHTPLENPDILAFMIDQTLDALFLAVRTVPQDSTPGEWQADVRMVDPSCRCALNPFIGYYLAAESALVAAVRSLPTKSGAEESQTLCAENELLRTLHAMGRSEINGFCEVCRIMSPASTAAPGNGSGLPAICPFKLEQLSTRA